MKYLIIIFFLIACSEENITPRIDTLEYNEALYIIDMHGARNKPIIITQEYPLYLITLFDGYKFRVSETNRRQLCIALKLNCTF